MSSPDATFIIETRALTKAFGDCVSNKAVDLKVRQGTLHAIIGENGAGKSTLMKLLFGLERPTSGEILIRGQKVNFRNALESIGLGIGMVQQHFALVENASAIENIILGAEPSRSGVIDFEGAIKKMESLLPSETLRVPWQESVEQLSVGFRQRVEILKVIYRKAEIMIFDEPTAVLTPQESEELYKILSELKKSGKTILLITHKIEDVLKYADDYSVLRRGELVGSGRVSETNMKELVRLMVGRALELPQSKKSHRGEPLLRIQRLRTLGPRSLKEVNLTVHEGEILGIAGIEGAGQKPLVDCIMGLKNYEGEIHLKNIALSKLSPFERRKLGIANVPEDRIQEGIWPSGSAAMNLVPGREELFFKNGFLITQRVREMAKKWFEQFDVRVPSPETPSERLSGGNQQKLILARELSDRQISLMICHQPTRGVDIGAIERIHKLLLERREQKTGIILISSDIDELFNLSDRLIVMYEGRVVEELSRDQFDLHRVGEAMIGARHGT